MNDRRYVVEYGDVLYRRVGRAPEREPGDFLTKIEAAERIIAEMDEAIWLAKDSRRRAVRVLAAERKKTAASAASGIRPPLTNGETVSIPSAADNKPTLKTVGEPCAVCGNEERGQGGYLSCECPAPATKGQADE